MTNLSKETMIVKTFSCPICSACLELADCWRKRASAERLESSVILEFCAMELESVINDESDKECRLDTGWLKVGTKEFEEASIKHSTLVEFFRCGMNKKRIGILYLYSEFSTKGKDFVETFFEEAVEDFDLKPGDYIKVIDLAEDLPNE